MKKIFLMILCLLLPGCASNPVQEVSGSKGDAAHYKIGFSMCNVTIEYLALLRDEMLAYRKTLGMEDTVELIILDAMSDPATQNSQVDSLIAQKVDCIIMIPFDRVQQVPAVEAAKKAGIPLLEFCASTISEDRTTYVGSDDQESGKLLAVELLRQSEFDEPRIVVLHGPTGQNAEVMRHTGLETVLEQYPKAQIVAERNCEWDRSKALDAVGNLVQSGDNFDIIFSENDEMAMGALIALEAAQRRDVLVGGVDALPDALNAVKEGRMACTVFQNAKKQSTTAFDVALKLARGESVEKEYSIPYELVTKDNAHEYE